MRAADEIARRGTDGLYAGRGDRVPGVQRIAVLRANAVGDLVVALPALAALRRAYPEATISLLGRTWHAQFLRGRPSPVDEVIVLPDAITLGEPSSPCRPSDERAGQDELDRAAAFIAEMREQRFDIALQLHGGGRHSNPFVLTLGARVTAGLRAKGAVALQRNLPYRTPHPEVLRLLETVALVGAQGHDVEPRLAVTQADRDEAQHALQGGAATAARAVDDRPLLVLQPGCADRRRAWRAEAFAAIGDGFARRGARVVLNGTRAEAGTLERVGAAMREPVLDLAGVLSLGGLLGLLSRARLLVSNDTGTAHLARAVDLPSVTICWIGNLAAYGPMGSDRHAVALSWQLTCPRCGRVNVSERCEHDDSFVDTVRIDEVQCLADELWLRDS